MAKLVVRDCNGSAWSNGWEHPRFLRFTYVSEKTRTGETTHLQAQLKGIIHPSTYFLRVLLYDANNDSRQDDLHADSNDVAFRPTDSVTLCAELGFRIRLQKKARVERDRARSHNQHVMFLEIQVLDGCGNLITSSRSGPIVDTKFFKTPKVDLLKDCASAGEEFAFITDKNTDLRKADMKVYINGHSGPAQHEAKTATCGVLKMPDLGPFEKTVCIQLCREVPCYPGGDKVLQKSEEVRFTYAGYRDQSTTTGNANTTSGEVTDVWVMSRGDHQLQSSLFCLYCLIRLLSTLVTHWRSVNTLVSATAVSTGSVLKSR